MKRSTRLELARETVAIVDQGRYATPGGTTVVISALVAACREATRFFTPEGLAALREDLLIKPAPGYSLQIEVTGETTLAGARRLLAERPDEPLAALNFASAKNPGGGFLSGSQAQEESLARSSALYTSLLQAPEYYTRHRGLRSCLYTDAMILSPHCPVFRDDAGELLPEPYRVTFLTSCAPNAGAVASNTPDELPQIPTVLRRRADLVLALAAGHGYRTLVLGAWGCGVFHNDPGMVATIFAELLRGPWLGRFERVLFAVYDTSREQTTLARFRDILAD